MFPQATLRCSLITNRLTRGGGSMTRLPYHDLPPDPTDRSPRGICWKVSPSGRLRSGWAFRSGRYTSGWSASERTCASNWRNEENSRQIPSRRVLKSGSIDYYNWQEATMATVSRTESQTRRRPIGWGGVLVGVSLAWLFLVGYAERRLEGNRLWLMGATYDAGVVPAGAVIAHRVWVFNPTGSTLEVDVLPHCGCTVVEEPKRRMLPLTGFPLTVQVDTTGKRAGAQEQRVELIVRDGRYSWRELITVRFTVQDASLSR